MRVPVLLLLLAAPVMAQETRSESHPTSQPAAESRRASLWRLIGVGTSAADSLKGDHSDDAAQQLFADGIALQREGRDDEALKCFERLAREWPERCTGASILAGRILARRGDFDAAVSMLDRALAASDENENDRSLAYRHLGFVQELRGDWGKALDAWEKERPPAGFGGAFGPAERQVHIAKCRFHLGQVDRALEILEDCIVSTKASEASRPFISEAAFAYAEYCGRSGRLDEARKFATTLPPDRRALVLDSIKVVESWLSKDPVAVMKAVAETNLDDARMRAAGRLLADLGPTAIELLTRGIALGDATSIRMAGGSGRRELLEALQKRLVRDPDDDAVSGAINDIESVTTRPASRRAK